MRWVWLLLVLPPSVRGVASEPVDGEGSPANAAWADVGPYGHRNASASAGYRKRSLPTAWGDLTAVGATALLGDPTMPKIYRCYRRTESSY